MRLEAFYGFNEQQSEAAYSIYQNNDIPIKQAFDWVDDICSFFNYDEKGKLSAVDLNTLIIGLSDVKYVYLNVVQEIGTAIDIVGEIKALGYNPLDFSSRFLQTYHNQDAFPFEEFVELAKFFEERICNVDECFEHFSEFVGRVMFGESPENALCDPEYQITYDSVATEYDEMVDDPFTK